VDAEPGTHVAWIDQWYPQTVGLWARYLKQHYQVKVNDGSVLIFDGAQATYWDTGLWNTFLKEIKSLRNRVILFTGRGSPTSKSRPYGSIPVHISVPQKVTLRRVDHSDSTPAIGLLLTQEEYEDFVSNRSANPDFRKFDKTFYAWLYHQTAGHVGAIETMLMHIASQSVRTLMRCTMSGDFDIFFISAIPQVKI
jgi:hypothetical protein